MKAFLSGLISFIAFVSMPAVASEHDEVCAIRPDLCGDAPQKPVARKAIRKSVSSRQPASVNVASTPVGPSSSSSASSARASRMPAQLRPTDANRPREASPQKRSVSPKRCRIAGQPYALEAVDLQVCKSHSGNMDDTQEAASTPSRQPPAPSEPSRMNFAQYLNNNANHPAIIHHNVAQGAFQDTSKPVTFNLPSDGGSVREGDVVQAQTPGTQAQTPPQTQAPH